MKKSKISKLYRNVVSLTKQEKKDILAFMKMPTNKLSERDQTIFSAYLQAVVANPLESEQIIWETILNKTERKNNRIKSRLVKMIERYRLLQFVEEDEKLASTCRAIGYSKKGMQKDAQYYLTRTYTSIDQDENRTLNDELFRYWLLSLENTTVRGTASVADRFQAMQSALSDFYLYNSYRLKCALESYQQFLAEEKRRKIKLIRRKDSCVHALQEQDIFRKIKRMIVDKDDAAYDGVRRFLIEHPRFFSDHCAREIKQLLINHCIYQINEENEKYANEFLAHIEELEAGSLLLNNGCLSIATLKNCVTASIMTKRLDWIKSFIRTYEDKLLDKTYLKFYHGTIAFFEGDIDTCRELLHKFKNSSLYAKDAYHRISCDKLMIKVFYQEGSHDLTEAAIQWLLSYIKKNTMFQGESRNKQLNFLQLAKDLLEGRLEANTLFDTTLAGLDREWLKKMARRNPSD